MERTGSCDEAASTLSQNNNTNNNNNNNTNSNSNGSAYASICDATAHFVAGWVSGCGGVLVSHPFDTVKIRLQTQGVASSGTVYTGTWQCLRCTVEREGARGLFKGMSSPLLGTAVWNAVVFGAYGNTISWLCRDTNGREVMEKQFEMKNVFIASKCES